MGRKTKKKGRGTHRKLNIRVTWMGLGGNQKVLFKEGKTQKGQ